MRKASVHGFLQKAKAMRIRVIVPITLVAIALAVGAFVVTAGLPFSGATRQAVASPAASTPTPSLSMAQRGVDPYVVWMWHWNSQRLNAGEFLPRQQNIDPGVYAQLPWTGTSSDSSGGAPAAGPGSGVTGNSIDPHMVLPWNLDWKNVDRGRFNGQGSSIDPKIYTAPFTLPVTPPSRLG